MRSRLIILSGASLYFAAKGAAFLNSITENLYIEAVILIVLLLGVYYIVLNLLQNGFSKKEE